MVLDLVTGSRVGPLLGVGILRMLPVCVFIDRLRRIATARSTALCSSGQLYCDVSFYLDGILDHALVLEQQES